MPDDNDAGFREFSQRFLAVESRDPPKRSFVSSLSILRVSFQLAAAAFNVHLSLMPEILITLGDPAGIGPEVVDAALASGKLPGGFQLSCSWGSGCWEAG